MASDGRKLELRFLTDSGDKKTVSINYAKSSPTLAQVKACGNAFVTNTDIFEETYESLVSAQLVTTSVTAYDLSYESTRQEPIPLTQAIAEGWYDEDGEPIIPTKAKKSAEGAQKTSSTEEIPFKG